MSFQTLSFNSSSGDDVTRVSPVYLPFFWNLRFKWHSSVISNRHSVSYLRTNFGGGPNLFELFGSAHNVLLNGRKKKKKPKGESGLLDAPPYTVLSALTFSL